MDLHQQEEFEAWFVSQMPPVPVTDYAPTNVYGDFASVESLLRLMYRDITSACPDFYQSEAVSVFSEDEFTWFGGQMVYERIEETRRDAGLYDHAYSIPAPPAQVPLPLAVLLGSIGRYNNDLGVELLPAHGVNGTDGSAQSLPSDVTAPPQATPAIRSAIDFKKLRDRIKTGGDGHVDGIDDPVWYNSTGVDIQLDGARRGQRVLASRQLAARYARWVNIIKGFVPMRPFPRGNLRQAAWAQSVTVGRGLELRTEPTISQLDRARAMVLCFTRHEWASLYVPVIKGRALRIHRPQGLDQLRSEYLSGAISTGR